MNDSTSPVMAGATPPAQDGAAKSAPPRPSLAFADAETAKRWAKGLPLTNVAQAFEAVHGQLRALSAADFAPRERATIAEVLRDQVALPAHRARAPLRGQAAAGGGSRARGRRPGDRALAGAVGAVFGVPEAAARRRPRACRRQGRSSCSAASMSASRCSSCYGLARRVPPAALWQELHAYYRLAEMLECAVTAVSDELMPQRGRHLLLFDLHARAAAGSRRSLRDVGEADRAHRPLARHVVAQGFSVRAAARDRRSR